jgi:TatD DNase family protein
MFSPSSTIEEAEEFHNVLLQSDIQSRNNIDIRMSVGIHPYHTGITEIGSFLDGSGNDNDNGNDNDENIKQRIKTLLEKDEDKKYITCIGETGLDYSDGFPNKKEQLPWFEFQLHQAKLYNMPLFIHERLAFDDTIALIDKVFPKEENGSNGDSDSDSVNIIIHCYTGNKEELKEYISRGYYISLSGYILKKGDGPIEINNCLKDGMIPLEKLMIETDAPYMGYTKCRESYYEVEALINDDFQSLKSKKKKSLVKGIYPNVPSALPNVLEHVVECLNEGRKERGEEVLDVEYVASTLFQNSKNFFGIQ